MKSPSRPLILLASIAALGAMVLGACNKRAAETTGETPLPRIIAKSCEHPDVAASAAARRDRADVCARLRRHRSLRRIGHRPLASIAGATLMTGDAGLPGGTSLAIVLPVMIAIGLAAGAVNALLITRLRLIPFVVTLATLYLGCGFALWLTETRAMNLPDSFLAIGASRVAGVPVPVLIFLVVVAVAYLILGYTPFGRQVFAVGQDAKAARKAGIPVARILAAVHVISGVCAAIGAIVALAQPGAVSPRFGLQKEFAAIAAAVLGGTSVFGGRGNVFPGTVIGAVLMQTVENGLVMASADPCLYPLVTSAIIFVAVLLDSARNRLLATWRRRAIRVEP